MIPIRDKNPSRTFPVVNTAIIALNVLVFFYELSLGPELRPFLYRYGLVPAALFYSHAASVGGLHTLLTSMFLHGGLMHLAGNMIFLYIFGDNVEDRYGHGPYVLFYMAAGVGAALTQIAINPSSTVPMVGASGAISGVMGAYMVLFPQARIITLVPVFLFFTLVEMPAVVFVMIWFVMQFLFGLGSTVAGSTGPGVAWWAHVGGFVTGAAITWALRRVLR